MIDAVEMHDEDGGDCWCQPERRCAECDTVEACVHGSERPEIWIHRYEAQ